jgi:hypothetical protein
MASIASLSQLAEDGSNFKTEDDVKNQNETRIAPPEFIIGLDKNLERADLTDEQLAEAKLALWNNKFLSLQFPRQRKFRVDPLIPGQSIGIVSFIPSPGSRPDKQGCYGVVKLRGNFQDQMEAERYGAMLMRKYDAYAEYDLVRVGQEFPLMIDNSVYTAETREINIKAIVDDVSLSYIRKKKQQERQDREEVEERARRLVNADNEEEKQTTGGEDLEYYTMLRTKKAHCQHVIDEAKRRAVEAEEALVKINKEVAELDERFPTYKKDYIAQYDRALKSIGADATKNPLIQYMKKDAEEARLKEQQAKEQHEEKSSE